MTEPLVLSDTKTLHHVHIITLNRAKKRNAFSVPLLEQLCHALEEAHADPDARAIILTGAGPVFCAGLDLTEARDTELAHRSAELAERMYHDVMCSPLVTIAAGQGAALAGGAGLLLACDIAVVANDFKMGFPEVRRGLVAGLVMTFVRRKAGEAKARELLLLGDTIGAEEAKQLGMVSKVVSKKHVMDEALNAARTALKAAPMAVARTKKLYDELYTLPLEGHLEHALELHKHMRVSDEAKEGLAAYDEKRLPCWDPESDRHEDCPCIEEKESS